MKVALCSEEKSDSYKGLAKVIGAGEGSEVVITEKINNGTTLDACKGPHVLEVEKNTAAESSPASDNAGSEANNDCETDIEEP